MPTDFQGLMNEATRLVRAGDLHAATAAIQTALRANAPGPRHTAGMPAATDIVIDVEARDVDEGLDADLDAPALRAPRQARQQAPLDARGSFLPDRFEHGRMRRDYKLYVPPQAGERPLPLVVMLHGCTQDPDDFAVGTRMNELARTHGCFVLYPAQSRQANPQRCWNWFKHNHQQRGRGEPALLAAMTRHVMAGHDIDPDRVYVAGLSAGGAMAAILGEAYPDLYAAVGVHSGLASGAARDLPSALAAMRSGGATASGPGRPGRPTIVFHGDADATVHPDNGNHVFNASVGPADAQHDIDQQRPASGRGYTRRVYRSAQGDVQAEHWLVHGSGHAWSGGSRQGSFTDPDGPDASQQMLRFFLERRLR